MSAATFSGDGEHAIFADKFGDVYVAATAAPEQVTLPTADCTARVISRQGRVLTDFLNNSAAMHALSGSEASILTHVEIAQAMLLRFSKYVTSGSA